MRVTPEGSSEMLNQRDNQCNGDTERSAEALAIDDLHISATARAGWL